MAANLGWKRFDRYSIAVAERESPRQRSIESYAAAR